MTWPNLLSGLRIALIPVFIIALFERHPTAAILIFLVASVSDLLDGYLARALGQTSTLGAFLDAVADKLLMTSSFVILTIPGVYPGLTIPLWITVLVIARDVIIVLVVVIVRLELGIRRFTPSWLSKWNTAVQLCAVVAVLLTGIGPGFHRLASVLLLATAALTLASGLAYAHRFLFRAEELAQAAGEESSRESVVD